MVLVDSRLIVVDLNVLDFIMYRFFVRIIIGLL